MIPIALTIAGSDSSGGAGIQADIKAMQAKQVFAASVITAVTAQNTREVTGIHEIPPAMVGAQIDAVLSDLAVGAIKTGMLFSAAIIEVVAERLAAVPGIPVVVDPVMVSKSGARLLQPDAVAALAERLLPRADLLTPNAPEAAVLAEMPVETLEHAWAAARALHARGAKAVLVKGGHLGGEESVDVLFDGERVVELRGPRVDTPHTHGTGCTLSAAIAALLARGMPLPAAVVGARRYLEHALRHALPIGGGHGPLHHFYFLDDPPLRG